MNISDGMSYIQEKARETHLTHTESLNQVCDSVFIYTRDEDLRQIATQGEYSKTQPLRFHQYDTQSYEKIDLAVYNLLRQCVVNLAKATGFYDLLLCFDAMDYNHFVKSYKLQLYTDAIDWFPVKLFVYMEFENDTIVFKMQFTGGHSATPLMKIDFSQYPNYFVWLV